MPTRDPAYMAGCERAFRGETCRLEVPDASERRWFDVLMSPVAYVITLVAQRAPGAIAAVVPLLWLLTVFSRERKERYAAALELSQTYRGTVMVLW